MRDELCRRLVEATPNLSVPWWLMAQYAYRIDSDPILTDGAFDWLCGFMLQHWADIDHPHKYLITDGDLRTGSDMGIAFAGDYPHIVRGALNLLRGQR